MWYRTVLSKKYTSVIVAFFLPADKARELKLQRSELPGESKPETQSNLHMTLLYLGKADELEPKRELITEVLKAFASRNSPITGKISGFGRFTGGEENDALYASIDAPKLPIFHSELTDALEAAGLTIDRTHGFTPHITLSYLSLDDPMPDLQVDNSSITFEKLHLAWAGERQSFSLK